MIIDSHVHFYDPTRPEGVPWPPRDNKVLYRRVMPEHCKALAGPLGVTGTVVVEASVWIEDNQWILDLAAKEPFIVGFVGNLTPGTEGFSSHLDRFAQNRLFRGIRTWRKLKESLADGCFLADLEKLAERDLSLDLPSTPTDLPLVAQLAERAPDLRIVVNHVAGVRIDGKTPDPTWVEGIRAVAKQPQVFCKVSGLVEGTGRNPAPSDLSYYKPTIDVLWDALGEDRLLYGSNWPVCELFSDYATVHRIVTEYFNEKGRAAAEKYFWRNSKKAYKWIER
ncbi:MAG: amidohydrolase family protein [Candidatus Bathyarchaeia archaeon]